ncbi:hypothetical protein D3C86_1628850 [compost metagenome]
MQRHKQQHAGHGLRDARMTCPFRAGCGVFSGKHETCKLDQSGCGFASITFQRIAILEQVVIEIEDPRLDHVGQNRARQTILFDRCQKRCSHRVGLAVTVRIAIDKVAPPLHAHFAGQRLTHGIADAGDFGVEGIERGKGIAPVGRRQKAGKITVTIGIAQRREADVEIFCGCHGSPRETSCQPSTAISAAATARDSESMIL